MSPQLSYGLDPLLRNSSEKLVSQSMGTLQLNRSCSRGNNSDNSDNSRSDDSDNSDNSDRTDNSDQFAIKVPSLTTGQVTNCIWVTDLNEQLNLAFCFSVHIKLFLLLLHLQPWAVATLVTTPFLQFFDNSDNSDNCDISDRSDNSDNANKHKSATRVSTRTFNQLKRCRMT